MKRRNIARLFAVLLIMSLMLSVLPLAVSAQENELITTRSEFEKALNSAKDGDTILVGDIDFNLNSTGAVNTVERITIDKNITIKSGKTDGNAVFTGASFILNGTKIGGKSSSFVFEGIVFDEGLDTSTLTDEDWQLSYDSQGEELSPYPLKNQYAIQCKGNASASFKNCEFKNYMHTYGPAIRAFYGDYTLTPSLEAEHGDNVPYKLELNLEGCSFSSNASLYGGGAVYVEAADKNVTLNVKDCSFKENKSGFVQNAVGGGAVFVKNTVATFEGCVFEKNDANYYYGGERFWADKLCGGAIGCDDGSSLTVRNCKIIGNKASFGGGIGVLISNANIEDCYISENKAIPETESASGNLGLCSERGLGGAIYLNGATNVTVSNTEIRKNYAENAMGAIYTDYAPSLDYSTRSVELLFCTIEGNTCKMNMSDYMGYGEDRWLWYSWYTDFFDISYLEYYGNLVVDGIYETHLPKTEQPTEENGYNYFGSTAPSEWYNDEGHLVHAPTVSTDFIKEKLGDKNYYGTFTVGANNHDVTFRFFADGEWKHTVTVPSGVIPTLPDLLKTGYTLTSWTLGEEMNYDQGSPLVVGNETENVDIYAVYTPNIYKVTFDFGYNQTEATQTFGEALSLPEVIERTGYTFVGWFTLADGKGEKLTDGANFMTAENVTYYAFYEPIVVTPPSEFPTVPVIIVSVVILLIAGGAVCFIILRRKKAQQAAKEATEATAADVTPVAPAEPRIVKTRYTDEEIDRIIEGTKEAQMLTDRELDVFRELLKGKKQSEISYYLGITVNTVKDYAGRVYAKFGVANKNALFEIIDSKLSKKE